MASADSFSRSERCTSRVSWLRELSLFLPTASPSAGRCGTSWFPPEGEEEGELEKSSRCKARHSSTSSLKFCLTSATREACKMGGCYFYWQNALDQNTAFFASSSMSSWALNLKLCSCFCVYRFFSGHVGGGRDILVYGKWPRSCARLRKVYHMWKWRVQDSWSKASRKRCCSATPSPTRERRWEKRSHESRIPFGCSSCYSK